MEDFNSFFKKNKKEKEEKIINFQIGAKVEWDPKMFSDPLHPRERTIKEGVFEVVDILTVGRKDNNPTSIGGVIEQVVRIKLIEIEDSKKKKKKKRKKDVENKEEETVQKIEFIDVSSKYLRLKK